MSNNNDFHHVFRLMTATQTVCSHLRKCNLLFLFVFILNIHLIPPLSLEIRFIADTKEGIERMAVKKLFSHANEAPSSHYSVCELCQYFDKYVISDLTT